MKYKHYIQVDEAGRIIAGWSNGSFPDRDTAGAILLTDQGGYQFRLEPGGEENPVLTNPDGTHRYIYDPSLSPAYREATAEELEQERTEIEAAAYSLPDHKAARVAESKDALAVYLEDHPLLWSDGKRYSVTMEKQTLLTSVLARYQIAAAAGFPPELRWNASGEECTVWAYEDLAALALAIAAYVEPLVSRQQALEVEIMAAQSREELEGLKIDYSAY